MSRVPTGDRLAPQGTAGVGNWVVPPQPAGTTAAGVDGKIHAQKEKDIWVEEHLELVSWHTVVNGLPFWQYVYHTRIDVPTDIQLHYGACQANRPCIRLYDGYLGQSTDLARTYAWKDSSGKISGWTAVTYNDSFFAPLDPNYEYDDDDSRGAVLCHEGGHSVGLYYHRTINNSCMLDPSPEEGMANAFNGDDLGYLNAAY